MLFCPERSDGFLPKHDDFDRLLTTLFKGDSSFCLCNGYIAVTQKVFSVIFLMTVFLYTKFHIFVYSA